MKNLILFFSLMYACYALRAQAVEIEVERQVQAEIASPHTGSSLQMLLDSIHPEMWKPTEIRNNSRATDYGLLGADVRWVYENGARAQIDSFHFTYYPDSTLATKRRYFPGHYLSYKRFYYEEQRRLRKWKEFRFWNDFRYRKAYSYDQQGRLTHFSHQQQDEERWETIDSLYREYNEAGLKIAETTFELYLGTTLTVWETWKGTYNEAGQLIETETSAGRYPTRYLTNYVYDDKGRMVEIISRESSGGPFITIRYEMVYDSLGRLSESYTWHPYTDPRRSVFSYDSRNRLIEEARQDRPGQMWENLLRLTNIYNNTGQRTVARQELFSNGGWSLYKENLYQYTTDGQLLDHQYVSPTNLQSQFRKRYTYDSQGRPTSFQHDSYDIGTQQFIPEERLLTEYDDTEKTILISRQIYENGSFDDTEGHKRYYFFEPFAWEVQAVGPPVRVLAGPNPIEEAMTLTFPQVDSLDAKLHILDTQGHQVVEIIAPGKTGQIEWWPAPSLKNGLYIYHLILGERKSSGKMILRR